MIKLVAVSLKNGDLLTRPPNASQMVVKWAELISDLSSNLVNLFLALFSDPVSNFDNLVSLE